MSMSKTRREFADAVKEVAKCVEYCRQALA
jgi:hypothetical protein